MCERGSPQAAKEKYRAILLSFALFLYFLRAGSLFLAISLGIEGDVVSCLWYALEKGEWMKRNSAYLFPKHIHDNEDKTLDKENARKGINERKRSGIFERWAKRKKRERRIKRICRASFISFLSLFIFYFYSFLSLFLSPAFLPSFPNLFPSFSIFLFALPKRRQPPKRRAKEREKGKKRLGKGALCPTGAKEKGK